MKTFTDGKGKQRSLELNVGVAEVIRSSVTFRDGEPVNIYNIAEEDFSPQQAFSTDQGKRPTTLQRIITQPEVLCQVVHAAMECEFEEFARCMNGPGIVNATDALVREIISFLFPWAAAEMTAAYEATQALSSQVSAEKVKLVQTPEFQQLVNSAFANSPGTSQDVSESTPDR